MQASSIRHSGFLPFAAAEIVVWNLISARVAEGLKALVGQAGAIKQLAILIPVHVLRLVWLSAPR
jgi:ABC-type polysaccharide/polyol phosphate export permease